MNIFWLLKEREISSHKPFAAAVTGLDKHSVWELLPGQNVTVIARVLPTSGSYNQDLYVDMYNEVSVWIFMYNKSKLIIYIILYKFVNMS